MSCICYVVRSVGDIAPRMWKCPNHGRRACVGETSIIDNFFKQVKPLLSHDECWDLAYGFYKMKHSQARLEGENYFCEDHFIDDLRRFFRGEDPDFRLKVS